MRVKVYVEYLPVLFVVKTMFELSAAGIMNIIVVFRVSFASVAWYGCAHIQLPSCLY